MSIRSTWGKCDTYGLDRELVGDDILAHSGHAVQSALSDLRRGGAYTVRLLSAMIFFIILTAERYRRTYLLVSSCKDQDEEDIPDGDISLVLLEHLPDLLGLLDGLLGLGSGSNRLLQKDMSIGEQLVQLHFDIVTAL